VKLTLRQQLSQFTHILQSSLFPVLEESLGELDKTAQRLVAILAMIPLGRFVPVSSGWIGRPQKDRYALACAFVAKAVYGISLTRDLIQRLRSDAQVRQICGWNQLWQIPHEATFSRAFAEFAGMELPQFVHEALIAETQKDRLIGHIARDSTAICARERFSEPRLSRGARREAKRAAAQAAQAAVEAARTGKSKLGPRGPHKRYRGGKRPYKPCAHTRLHRQRQMKLEAMLADLPRHCSSGVKKSANGNQEYWRGYKLHLDVADGQIPISCVLTAASLHDSQVAIPLATMTAARVTSLYDVMDSAYDATEIMEHSRELGHVPIVKPARRTRKYIPFQGIQPPRSFTWAEAGRFGERTMVERVYARLKDEFGGRDIRVRGHRKIMAHLMFAVLALTADQILRLAT
jgi:Transposase DDE domain/Transposase domain (DUF772)